MIADVARRVEAVERDVPDAVRVRGHLNRRPLAGRMDARSVPGVSIAVINEGRIEWARGYGVTSMTGGPPVNERTLFQAASISKPVAAFSAMVLADQDRLDLDADVGDILHSWRLPKGPNAQAQPVTARRIMSHTAGLTLDGMPGYAPGSSLPSAQQILDGVPPAVNEPIRVAVEPGSEFRYSGGGYTVLELLIAEAAGRPFEEFAHQAVLDPCGMVDSTFAQPLPRALEARAASGHAANGTQIPGGWQVMPARAASGLWTTAPDLARLVIETQRALMGDSRLISSAAASEMLTPGPHGPAALGFWVEGAGTSARFFHTGSNTGYRAHVVGYADGGQGAAVLTNGDDGATLCLEVLNGIADVYKWPGFVRERVAVEVDPGVLDRYVGRYEVGGLLVDVTRAGDALVATATGFGSHRLYAESDTTYFFVDMEGTATFDADDAAGLRVLVTIGGIELRGLRR